MKTILGFARVRAEARPIVMVTAYDALMARIVAASDCDAILGGDSAAMVVHGLPSTVDATLEKMVRHPAAVRRGAPQLVVADLPLGTFRRGRHVAADAATRLMQAGATAVKLEGVRGHEEIIRHLVEGGIPVMGHVGAVRHLLSIVAIEAFNARKTLVIGIGGFARMFAAEGLFDEVVPKLVLNGLRYAHALNQDTGK